MKTRAVCICIAFTIPVIIVTVQNSIAVYQSNRVIAGYNVLHDQIVFSLDIAELLHNLHFERSLTVKYISSLDPQVIHTNFIQLLCSWKK